MPLDGFLTFVLVLSCVCIYVPRCERYKNNSSCRRPGKVSLASGRFYFKRLALTSVVKEACKLLVYDGIRQAPSTYTTIWIRILQDAAFIVKCFRLCITYAVSQIKSIIPVQKIDKETGTLPLVGGFQITSRGGL